MEQCIAVIDPSRLARAGLVSLLSNMDFDKIYEADSLSTLEQQEDFRQAELVIIRISLDYGDPGEMMEQVRKIIPSPRVMFLVPYLDINLLSECFAAGASGCLSESTSQETLMGSLRLVRAGGKVFPAELADLMSTIATTHHHQARSTGRYGDSLPVRILSERELDVLRELASGQSNKMIASKLGIAEGTVKVYVKRVLRKIGAGNRTQAALWAASHGIVEKSRGNCQQDRPNSRAM